MLKKLNLLFLLISLVAPAYAAPVEIIAHRGASHDAPENTMASVKLGWKQGADAVEVDVMLSKDGRIVVIHDKDTKRVAGVDRKVKDQTYAQLRRLDVGTWKADKWKGESIPSLAEVLATIPDGKRMFVELKTGPEIVPALKRVVKASGTRAEQIAIISFNLEACVETKKALPRHEVSFLSGFKPKGTSMTPKIKTLIRKAKIAGLDGLDVDGRKLNESDAGTAIHAGGLRFYVYTINDAKLARQLIQNGVDGITTDRPKWLRDQLR
ncbi:MAG: glycerophosphodiester phosphodiesterase [Verrucomicrobiales bacterium]|nr:glycerophosphodiester phosphodiesterase [Verrucomicrobiales bacterium]